MKRESVLTAEYKSKLLRRDGTIVDAQFLCFDDSMVNFDKSCRLLLEFAGTTMVFAANDFFAALDGIRQQLEPTGMVPLVNGASRTSYPSGMSRDMGMGLSLYRLRLGTPSTLQDLVQTFEDDAIDKVVTVHEQREFYNRWLSSLAGEA